MLLVYDFIQSKFIILLIIHTFLIVWNDIRTDETVDKILAKLDAQNKNHFKSLSGLTISPYFSALKLRWLKDNVPVVQRACRERRCMAGTIDSWLVWVCFSINTFQVFCPIIFTILIIRI